MENNSNEGMDRRSNLRGQQYENDQQNASSNEDSLDEAKASGDDIISEGLEGKHHQQHGNRKYESYTNHSSADDQPQNTTDTNLGREHNF